MKIVDVIIIGAGAAGLMCAQESGKRRRRTLVLDHANKPGKKILMSGGGRCNFTNLHARPEHFISHNPHFCKSALNRFTPQHFLELVHRHRIPYHEKTLGQLFCDHKSKDIVDLLLNECAQAHVDIQLNTSIEKIEYIRDHHFNIKTNQGVFRCESLVIATGGLSIPTMGASPFGYQIAEQFGLNVWPTRAGLVPLTLHPEDKERFSSLSGIAVESLVQHQKTTFRENILFTHRGISGPAILQISSYWSPGEEIGINLLPTLDLSTHLTTIKKKQPQKQLKTILSDLLPKRVVDVFLPEHIANNTLQTLSDKMLHDVATSLHRWALKPNGTEGYRTAEVTLGGVDCNTLSSKTMAAEDIPGLYFVGEVVDVTGWLGGFNFQWAWASGWAAGQVV